MANIIMKDVDAEKVSAKIIDDLYKVARALRERLAKGRDPRRRK